MARPQIAPPSRIAWKGSVGSAIGRGTFRGAPAGAAGSLRADRKTRLGEAGTLTSPPGTTSSRRRSRSRRPGGLPMDPPDHASRARTPGRIAGDFGSLGTPRRQSPPGPSSRRERCRRPVTGSFSPAPARPERDRTVRALLEDLHRSRRGHGALPRPCGRIRRDLWSRPEAERAAERPSGGARGRVPEGGEQRRKKIIQKSWMVNVWAPSNPPESRSAAMPGCSTWER